MRNGLPLKPKPKKGVVKVSYVNDRHDEDCLCTPCLVKDMNEFRISNGEAPYSAPTAAELDTSVRTRYAKPGQRVGRGVVRILSDKQIKFIKNLMADRDISKLVRLPGSEDIEHMSLRGATDLIDRLLACPELPKSQRKVRLASSKQLEYIIKEGQRRFMSQATDSVRDTVRRALAEEIVSSDDAREALDWLFKAPWAPRDIAPTTTNVSGQAIKPITEGLFVVGDDVFKVQLAVHGSGRPYAKKLNMESARFDYVGNGPLLVIREEHRMTHEQAIAIVAKFRVNMETLSHCFICGRPLTDEESMDRGIGPICNDKF